MGQKVNPVGLRLILNKKWQSQNERFQKQEAGREELTGRQKKI